MPTEMLMMFMLTLEIMGWVRLGDDDVESIHKKVNFINRYSLAGGIIWSLQMHHFHRNCHGIKYGIKYGIKFSLLKNSVEVTKLMKAMHFLITNLRHRNLLRIMSLSSA